MRKSAANRILTSKRRAWIGLIWAIGLTCMLVLPDVDESIRHYRELGTLRAELVSRSHMPDRSRMLAERVDQARNAMADLEAALVPDTRLSSFKQDITRMINDAGCRLLSIRPGPVAMRTLDEVLGSTATTSARLPVGTTWAATVQTSLISVAGSFEHHVALMAALDSEARILNLASLDLHTSTESPDDLALDLQLQTFDLSDVAAE